MIKLQEKETPQATFDFVVSKLREQGEPSTITVAGELTCAYGKPGGSRCAVGHLLGDTELTGESMLRGMPTFHDGATLKALVDLDVIEHPRSLGLIRDMQAAHDDPAVGTHKATGAVWAAACARGMLDVARNHALNPASAQAWLESLS